LGIGDDIMLTAKLKRIKSENPDKSIVPIKKDTIVKWSIVYENNPNVSNKITKNTILVEVRPRPYLYGFFNDGKGEYSKFKKYRPKPGEIYLTSDEIKRAQNKILNAKNFIYIEPNIGNSLVHGSNKDWGFKKWQLVVNSLPNLTFVQAGEPGSRKLKNVISIETSNIRDAFALLSLSKFYIGPEGGMHHAAAALDKKAIVIFGGVTSPESTGYDFHINLYNDDHPDSPCGRSYPCDHCKESMEKITVQDVIDSINSLMDK